MSVSGHEQQEGGLPKDIFELLENRYDLVMGVEAAWEELEKLLLYRISPDGIDVLLEEAQIESQITLDSVASSGEDVSDITVKIPSPRNARSDVLKFAAGAKWLASMRIYAEQSDQISPEEYFSDQGPPVGQYEAALREILGEVFERYLTAYSAEAELLDDVIGIARENPMELERLLAHLSQEEVSLDDYAGLLMTMARNHFEKSDGFKLLDLFDRLAEHPRYFQKKFIIEYLQQVVASETDSDVEIDDEIAWLKYMTVFVGENGIELAKMIDQLATEQFEFLPPSLQTKIHNDAKAYCQYLKNSWIELLAKYDNPKHHTPSAPPVFERNPGSSTKKTRKNGRTTNTPRRSSKRVTAKHASNIIPVEEKNSSKPVQEVCLGKRTGSGVVLEPIGGELSETIDYNEWLQVTAAQVAETKIFRDYVAKYKNPDDILAMVTQIITTPRGVGRKLYVNGEIGLRLSPGSRSLKRCKVFEYSAREANGTGNSQSVDSNKVRILYSYYEGTLIILGVEHRTAMENGFDFK